MSPRYSIVMCVFAFTLIGCAHIKKKDYSEIDVATVTGCAKPSMSLNELRDERSRAIAADTLPVRVKPGTYTIALECTWAHDVAGACVDTRGNPELRVPPYDLILYPKVRYAFSCDLEGKEYVIRMREDRQ